MRDRNIFLCLDAGTTRFKAAAIDSCGNVLAEKGTLYALRGEIHHEYEAEDFILAMKETIRDIGEKLDLRKISGIGISGHGPSLIPMDINRNPLFPAVGYLDDRVKKYIRRLVDKREDIITSTMYIPIALFFKEECPTVYKKTSTFLQPFDYLSYRITGVKCTTSSSSGIKPWSTEKIVKAGLDPDKFPPIVYMGEQIGKTNCNATELFGIPEDVSVYAVGVDFAAALIGTNSLYKGRSCERAGSSGGINLCWDHSISDNRLLCYPHLTQGHWNIAGITSTYGKAIEWAKDVFRDDVTGKGIEVTFDENSHQKPPILFFPYLKGERSPLWNPDARGVFFGLTITHNRKDMLRAVYTGVAFSIRDCIEIIREHGARFIYPVVTTGGLANNDWFTQLKSDVTGLPFTITQLKDAELLGIATILSRASGLYPDLQTATRNIVKEGKIFEPRKDMHKYYSELFARYKELQEKIFPP
ncbi:MAG: xylulokinase [Spirochaetota bacterium]